MADFDLWTFARECFLRSEPSVDIDAMDDDEPISYKKHRLSQSNYNAILHKFGVLDENNEVVDCDRNLACGLFILSKGPCLYDDKAGKKYA